MRYSLLSEPSVWKYNPSVEVVKPICVTKPM